MQKIIKLSLISALLLFSFIQSAFSETTVYLIRVDGLACPYCAYGIEKKLNELEGVKFISMDLDTGVVTVESYHVKLEEEKLKQLFQDSGFTYRNKKESVK